MRNLTLSLLAVVLIATMGLGWMFDALYNQYSEQSELNQNDPLMVLEPLGQNMADTLNSQPHPNEFITDWPNNNAYTLALTSINQTLIPPALKNDLLNGKPLVLETDTDLTLYYYLANHTSVLMLRAPMLNPNRDNADLRLVLTSLFYFVMLLLMVAWLAPLALRLLALRKTAKLFGEGQLNQRISVGSISYIKDIETEFNHMAERIEALVNDVKLLSSAVSHDLRTPLARIRFGIDTLQEEDDPVLRKRYEQRISDNVDEMVDLVETLLNYARLDQAMISLTKSAVNVNDLVTHCLKNKTCDGRTLNYLPAATPCFIDGDQAYLNILINNLVQNALQYCKQHVTIEVFIQPDTVSINISDDGPGIAPEHYATMLQPFTRGELHRQTIKGFGMGLAIATRVTKWHHGTLTIGKSDILGGAKFSLTLPKKNVKDASIAQQ